MNLQEIQDFTRKFVGGRYMAVVGSIFENEPRTFTCWYIVVDGKIYWKSRTASEHSRAFIGAAGKGMRNINMQNSAALCIYDHNVKYPNDKTGVQMIGKVDVVTDRNEMEKVLEKMAGVFGDEVLRKNNIEDLLKIGTNSTFYSFTPNGFKLVSKELSVHMENYENINL